MKLRYATYTPGSFAWEPYDEAFPTTRMDRLAFLLMDIAALWDRKVWRRQRFAERLAWTCIPPCRFCGQGASLWVHRIGWWLPDGWRPGRYV